MVVPPTAPAVAWTLALTCGSVTIACEASKGIPFSTPTTDACRSTAVSGSLSDLTGGSAVEGCSPCAPPPPPKKKKRSRSPSPPSKWCAICREAGSTHTYNNRNKSELSTLSAYTGAGCIRSVPSYTASHLCCRGPCNELRQAESCSWTPNLPLECVQCYCR